MYRAREVIILCSKLCPHNSAQRVSSDVTEALNLKCVVYLALSTSVSSVPAPVYCDREARLSVLKIFHNNQPQTGSSSHNNYGAQNNPAIALNLALQWCCTLTTILKSQ